MTRSTRCSTSHERRNGLLCDPVVRFPAAQMLRKAERNSRDDRSDVNKNRVRAEKTGPLPAWIDLAVFQGRKIDFKLLVR